MIRELLLTLVPGVGGFYPPASGVVFQIHNQSAFGNDLAFQFPMSQRTEEGKAELATELPFSQGPWERCLPP